MIVGKSEVQMENVFGDLVHYYQVRMSALSDFSTRTWHRFNWFMTVHLGAFAFVFSSLVKVGDSDWYGIISGFVAMTALVWCLLGYEDFKQMQKYGIECKEIERVFLATLAERESLRFNFDRANDKKGILPFMHARLLYLFPLAVLFSWSALSVYLF